MKYANYKFNARGVNNLGDNMQIIAIDYIYEKMGIPQDEIVYVDTNDLATYKGEYIILPVAIPLVDYREGGIAKRFSEHIIPVFLGLTMVKETLELDEVEYLKKFAPIGCRDEKTLNMLRKYQIDCYLHGCITVTLPKRKSGINAEDIYIVDIDPSIQKLIPFNLRANAKFRTHLRSDLKDSPKQEAMKQYMEYKENSKLIITSLLHCAVPCMAAGIPVIIFRKQVTYRMAWLEKLLPIYTPDKLQEIQWNPKSVDIEEHKKRVLNITINRLKNAYMEYSERMDLSWFYEDRIHSNYINDACVSIKSFIDTYWSDHNKSYNYSFWGMTQIGEWIFDYIKVNYPNAKLCHVYDKYRIACFKGVVSSSPELIERFPLETVFVTTNGAQKEAEILFNKINKPQGTYAYMKTVL